MGYHLLGFPAVFDVHSLTISNAKTSRILSNVYRRLLEVFGIATHEDVAPVIKEFVPYIEID